MLLLGDTMGETGNDSVESLGRKSWRPVADSLKVQHSDTVFHVPTPKRQPP